MPVTDSTDSFIDFISTTTQKKATILVITSSIAIKWDTRSPAINFSTKKVRTIAKEYNKDVFDQNCKILGICNERKIAFSLIKEQYEIKKHEVKDNLEKSLLISNTFISLRNQYENYLNSFHNKV